MGSVSIGVVILNWNGHVDTIACLESLAAADPGPTRVVVVDNASTDGSVAALMRWAGESSMLRPTIIRSGHNRGFAGGNNLGLVLLARDAGITHFLLLNNDATVEPAFFGEVAAAIERAPRTGLLGVTIYEGAGYERVWYAGGRLPNARAVTIHATVVPPSASGATVPTEFVTGCAMLVSRRAWDTLGPLPDCYFLYFEDAEYSLRAGVAGLPVVYAPQAVVHHAWRGTVRRVPRPRSEYWIARSRALFVRRNRRGRALWRTLAYFALARPARAAVELLRGRPRLAWAGLRGTIHGLLAIESQRDGGDTWAAQADPDGVVVQE